MFLRNRPEPAVVSGPDSGHRLGPEATLWHDCPLAGLSLRQDGRDGLTMETAGFAGSFLSLAIDLPDAARFCLTGDHVLHLAAHVDTRIPARLSARLNLVQGPNTETLQRDLAGTGKGGGCRAAFDLACAGLGDRPADRAWLDVIVAAPGENAIAIRDLHLSARWRAQV